VGVLCAHRPVSSARECPCRSFGGDDAVERLGVDPAGQAAAGFAQRHLAIAGQLGAVVQQHPIALLQLAERSVAGHAVDRGAPQHCDRGKLLCNRRGGERAGRDEAGNQGERGGMTFAEHGVWIRL